MSNEEVATAEPQEVEILKPGKVPVRISSNGLLEIDSLEAAYRVGDMVVKSGFAPKGMAAVQAVGAIVFGRELGLSVMGSLQNITVINGRPSVWGDAAIGIVQTHRDYVEHDEGWDGEPDSDAYFAWCNIVRRKPDGNPRAVHRTFSIADAKRAGLWGKEGPWRTYPKRMLQMRARGFAMRDAFPDALRGMNLREEAEDERYVDAEVSPAKAIAAPGAPVRVVVPTAPVVVRPDPVIDPPAAPAPSADPSPEDAAETDSLLNEWEEIKLGLSPEKNSALRKQHGIKTVTGAVPLTKLRALVADGRTAL